MIVKVRSIFVVLTLFSCTYFLTAQFSGTNLAEVQFGKLPNETDDSFPSIYDRLKLNYRYNKFKLGVTVEQYFSKYDERNYIDLSQATLSYKKKKWDIKLGNVYETLGRGLLLRAFEIQGALIEDLGFRSRTYFHRDLLGASVKYKTKKVSFHGLRVDVLNNSLPPIFEREDRRKDIINAFSGDYKYYKSHRLGVIVMNHQRTNREDVNYLSGFAKGPISKSLNYYFEYASNITERGKSALYTGINGSTGNLSFSIEYKRYDNFIIGAGINEPPALIKQHTYRVLNRSTHVTNPLNEEGYEVDLFYNFKNGSSLNVNHALAVNNFGAGKQIFQEYFVEYSSVIEDLLDYKIFVDYSQDPFKDEKNRLSGGIYTDIGLTDHVRLLPELEYQRFDRTEGSVRNLNFLLGLNFYSKYSLSMLFEWTNDPVLVRDGQTNRANLGAIFRYKPNYKNTVQIFGGERRGGPLCSAGVCYEILDFKGVEVRWTTRFRSH